MRFRFVTQVPSSPEKDWFEARFREVRARAEALADTAPDGEWLELVEHWNEVKAVFSGESSRRNWDESRDAKDATAEAAARRHRSESGPVAVKENAVVRKRLLGSRGRAAVERKYGKTLTALWECAEVGADPRNVDLDVEEKNLYADYGKLRGSAELEVDGKKQTLTQLANLGESPDAAVRKKAFLALEGFYLANAGEFDRLYARLVELRTKAARNLGFSSFVPLGYKRMSRTDYGPDDVKRFREAIGEHVVPLLREIRKRQAKDLGTSAVAGWDRAFFPAHALPPGVAPVEKQVPAARKVYAALDARLAKHFDRMVEKGLVDLENRPGKKPGAYCTSMPDRDEVRIFCNSTGAASDVGTLLHECGHAFQGWESQPIPLVEQKWPTFDACEIHSMGMELLSFPHLSAFFSSEEDVTRFKRQKLAKTIVLLAYVAVVDAFQHEVYEMPGMTPDERARAWSRLWGQFMVGEDWSGHEPTLARLWQRQLHVYGMPFYYVDYALAETCALQLYRIAKKDRADALRRYLRLCEIGGTKSFLGILAEGGLLSPFERGTLGPVVEMVREELAV